MSKYEPKLRFLNPKHKTETALLLLSSIKKQMTEIQITFEEFKSEQKTMTDVLKETLRLQRQIFHPFAA